MDRPDNENAPDRTDLHLKAEEPSLDGSDRCEQLEITVENNRTTILLLGKPVNDMQRDAAWDLLESLSSQVERGYALYDVPEKGVAACRWEYADTEIYCFVVKQPTKPNVAKDA